MQFNLADLYESHADAFPDRLALVSGPVRWTYRQLDDRANRLAQHWRAQGVGPGESIGLCLYNCHEYIECMLAAWKIGARTINVSFRYKARDLAYVFANADLVGLVTEAELRPECEAARQPQMRFVLERGPAYEEALAAASDARPTVPRSADDLVIIYTGGTTGMPRGVMWRHEDLFFAALQGGNPGGEPITNASELTPRMLENGGGINVLSAPPLIHGSAQLASWLALMNGGVAAVVPGRSLMPEAIWDMVQAEGIHTLNIVGDAMALPLVEVLEQNPGRWDLRELMVVTSAGAVLSTSVRERLEAHLPRGMVMNNFGASETGHQGAAFYDEGKPVWVLDERHTTVLDDQLDPVVPGSGVVGRIARFGHIPLGYYGDPVKTAATFPTRNGRRYAIPGDMATVQEDGAIVFLGRGSACINTGGEKVFAEEVEELLKAHPAVRDAIVVGLPDPRWGQRVVGLVTARGGPVEEETVLAWCRGQIAAYKVPKQLFVVESLARQPSGKPDYPGAQAAAAALAAAT